MNYKSPENKLTVPDSTSREELIKFWAMSQLAPEPKAIIIDVLKGFKDGRKSKQSEDFTS